MRITNRQTGPRRGDLLVGRFIATIGLAVAWSTVSIAGLDLGWVLIGAACIGILATVGAEPPRRNRPRPAPKAVPVCS